MLKFDITKYSLEDIALFNQLAGMIKDRMVDNDTSKNLSDSQVFDVCLGSVLEFAKENNITMKSLYEALLFYYVDWLKES